MAENNAESQNQEDISMAMGAAGNFQGGEDIDLDAVHEVPVEISVVLGQTSIAISDLLKMGKGAVIELNRKIGEPVDLYVNNRLVAKGEVVVVDEQIGITMTEIIKADKNE
jgi:flagellar motor switch protein FliN/FliY